MTGGAHVAVREGRGELGWVGSGWSGSAGFPGVAQVGSWPLSFIFIFFCFLFFFCSDFCFEFLKKLFYSDLNKIKADHFWSLKSVFRTYKLEV
jgi:hypothetical protein